MSLPSMHEQFEQRWARARRHEGSGDLGAARLEYAAILDDEADRLYVRLRLSALEQAAGRYRAAREHVLHAASTIQELRTWKHAALVTRRLMDFDETDAACDLIMCADWTDADILRNSAVLSQHLWLGRRFEDALRLIEAAARRTSPSHVLGYSKATALRYCGRMQEATSEYERCISLAPTDPYAHWSLAYHEPSTVPGARVERILGALDASPDTGVERAHLHYALFKELDHAGETASAWHHLRQGAFQKRGSLSYDGAREARSFNALELAFANPLQFPETMSEEDPGSRPIFIVGLPRTGTTLLERILGGHSRTVAGGELEAFGSALSQAADRFVCGTTLNSDDVHCLQRIDHAEVGRSYLARTRVLAAGAAVFTDKNPLNFVHVGSVALALPHARILCLTRAPMDACFSNLKELFSNDAYGYSYDLTELADHYSRFAALAGHWRKILPGRFMRVDYEALVAGPDEMTAEILAFCGLPLEKQCVDVARNTDPVSTASSSQVRQPIHGRGVGAWRRYETQLEPLRQRLIENGVEIDTALLAGGHDFVH